jgi:flagellar biosynthesis/type III secretory pathway protein FliH
MITISLDELVRIKFDKFFDELSFQNETPNLKVKQLLNKLENDIRSSLKIESRHSITEYEEVYDEGCENGRDIGYDEGKEDGYTEGYDQGYEEGVNSESYDRDTVYDEGYQSGYADGKAEVN